MTNNQIEEQISYLGKLMALHQHPEPAVKTVANSAFQIDRLKVQLNTLPHNHINSTIGIGKGTSLKIIELLTSGTLTALEELKAITPEGVQELLLIRGLGPKKVFSLWKENNITNPIELVTACNENRLIHLRGFTEKTQETILQATNFYLQSMGKVLYADATVIHKQILENLIEIFGTENIFTTGNYRRQETIIESFEFVINTPLELLIDPIEAHNAFTEMSITHDEVHAQFGTHTCILYPCEANNVMEQLFFSTGPVEFVNNFTELYPDVDYAISNQENDQLVFAQAGITYIPPYLRNANTHLGSNNTYNTITLSDIKGIIHNHSTYSDGAHTLEQMALACIKLKKEYLVISDHSQYASYAGGLDYEKILKQHAEIDSLNSKLAPFKIFKSIECDILPNGELDYTPEILGSFDIIIASIHSVFNMSEAQAMDRLLKAISNPYTSIIGHPTGRLLLGRTGYPVDMLQLIDWCAQYNVVVELNAHPRRLDIDWQYLPYAIEKNVLISINPDAHSMNGIMDIQYGVLAAQKGNIEARHNLSSYNLTQFQQFIEQQQAKRPRI